MPSENVIGDNRTPGFYWVYLNFGGYVPAELDDDGIWHPAGVSLEPNEVWIEEIGPEITPPTREV